MKNFVNSVEYIKKASVEIEQVDGVTPSNGLENSRGAKSDVALQKLHQDQYAANSEAAYFPGANATFTSHIPEENTDDFKSDVQSSPIRNREIV